MGELAGGREEEGVYYFNNILTSTSSPLVDANEGKRLAKEPAAEKSE